MTFIRPRAITRANLMAGGRQLLRTATAAAASDGTRVKSLRGRMPQYVRRHHRRRRVSRESGRPNDGRRPAERMCLTRRDGRILPRGASRGGEAGRAGVARPPLHYLLDTGRGA